ncbi:unnamed protein product [Polarella glacialis]|uniref:Uncharacterized protein n=1 Tax=Polarella glacialis TaxID=89957 RepID=A0A813HNY8_POLGL|nr:unnamed protein product [Polarella glacialis]
MFDWVRPGGAGISLERGHKVLEYHWNEVWISAFDALRADFHQFQNGQMLECESQLYDMWPSCLREWVGSARMSSYPCLEIISDVLLSIRVLNQSLSYELHARLIEPVHALPGSECSACLHASLTPWTVFGQWPAVYYPVRPLQGCDAGLCDSASMAADHPSIGLLLAEVMGALPAVRDALLALALQESEDLVGFNKNAAHNWLTKPIFKSARGWVAESCKHLPTLCTSLRKHLPSVPHPVTHWDAEDASINCLLPGGHVPPHADDYKGNLYVQTMVNLFGTSLFRFGGRATRLSGFGSSLTFDPSFMHEVENDGEHVRCLLSVRRARPLYHGSFRLVKVLPPGADAYPDQAVGENNNINNNNNNNSNIQAVGQMEDGTQELRSVEPRLPNADAVDHLLTSSSVMPVVRATNNSNSNNNNNKQQQQPRQTTTTTTTTKMPDVRATKKEPFRAMEAALWTRHFLSEGTCCGRPCSFRQLSEKCPSAVDLLQILRYSLRNARLVEAALADGIISTEAVLQVISEALPVANAILHEPGGDRYLDTLLTMFKEALNSVETRFMSLSGAALRFTLLHTEKQDARLLPNRRVVEQKLVLSNGVAIPQSGFGTEHLGGKWARTHNTDAYSLVLEALSVGYRMIDTAQAYENEAEVGLAIRHSGIPREDIAISTKLNTWQDQRWSEELVRDIFSQQLSDLGTAYVDIYMLHHPSPMGVQNLKSAWRVMEDLYRQGKIRALGVSNFGLDDLDALLSFARVRPVYLQSPFMLYDCGHEDACINSRFLSALEDFGITFVSFSSANEEVTPLPVLSDPHVCSLASRSSVSPAVLLRRWVLDHGVGVLARSKSKEHMLENLAAQALPALSAEAFALLNAVGALYSQTDFEFTAMESSSHQGAAILALPGIAIQADWQEEYSGLEQADNATCFPDALDATQPRASTSVVLGFHNLHCDIHFAIDQSGGARRMHDMLLKSFEEIVAEASAFGNLKETTFLHTASDGFSRPNCARFVQTCMALRRISAALLEDLPARLDLKSTLQDASLLRLRAGSRLVTGGSTLPGTQVSAVMGLLGNNNNNNDNNNNNWYSNNNNNIADGAQARVGNDVSQWQIEPERSNSVRRLELGQVLVFDTASPIELASPQNLIVLFFTVALPDSSQGNGS